MTSPPICPCGAPMVLRTTRKYRRPNGDDTVFWGCSMYPACLHTHGAHRNGKPLGIPANRRTRGARYRLHREFDQFWKSGAMSRRQAYGALAGLMGMTEDECHIGRFDLQQCERAIELLSGISTGNVASRSDVT